MHMLYSKATTRSKCWSPKGTGTWEDNRKWSFAAKIWGEKQKTEKKTPTQYEIACFVFTILF